jgi:hypothetical protein
VVDADLAAHPYTLTITLAAAGGRQLVCRIQPTAADAVQTSGADSGTWTAHDM